ncbi:hypothetical protein [Curvibacter sp. AEP1-3]|uniref:hypothetical protein n=1 Tax=Curvibacter sp. AEP1-3 TaxID=1844971 RepID=UPI0012F9236D|nr:hypothetical protein [Curvibacter sp. AEP1-3]
MECGDGVLPIQSDGLLSVDRFRCPILLVIKGEEFLAAVVDGEPYVYKSTIDLLRLIRISGIRIQSDAPISLVADDFRYKEEAGT